MPCNFFAVNACGYRETLKCKKRGLPRHARSCRPLVLSRKSGLRQITVLIAAKTAEIRRGEFTMFLGPRLGFG